MEDFTFNISTGHCWDYLFEQFGVPFGISRKKFEKYKKKLLAANPDEDKREICYDLRYYWETILEFKTKPWFNSEKYPVFTEVSLKTDILYEKAHEIKNYENDVELLNRKEYNSIAEEHKFLEQIIGKYKFIIPKTGEEIKSEAEKMRNCLWLRTPSYLENKWFFVYMRQVSDPAPLIDMVFTKESNHYAYGTPAWIILKDHEYVKPCSDEGKAIEMWYKKCFGYDIIWPISNKGFNN